MMGLAGNLFGDFNMHTGLKIVSDWLVDLDDALAEDSIVLVNRAPRQLLQGALHQLIWLDFILIFHVVLSNTAHWRFDELL